MGLSTNTYPYSGGAQTFAATFSDGYIEREHVTVFRVGDVDGLGNQNYLNFTWNSDTEVLVTDPLTAGDEITVQRTVPTDALITDLSAPGALTRESVERNARQTLHAVHEVYDGRLEINIVENLVAAQAAQAAAESARDDSQTAEAAALAAQVAAEAAQALAEAARDASNDLIENGGTIQNDLWIDSAAIPKLGLMEGGDKVGRLRGAKDRPLSLIPHDTTGVTPTYSALDGFGFRYDATNQDWFIGEHWSADQVVLTYGEGDARYARLDQPNVFTEDQTISQDTADFFMNGTLAARLYMRADNVTNRRIIWATAADPNTSLGQMAFRNDRVTIAGGTNVNDVVATFYLDGSIPSGTSVLTRDHGDARYAPIGGGVGGLTPQLEVFPTPGASVTLAATPTSIHHVDVFLDGVLQDHSDYSLAGNVVTFTGGAPVGVTKAMIKHWS